MKRLLYLLPFLLPLALAGATETGMEYSLATPAPAWMCNVCEESSQDAWFRTNNVVFGVTGALVPTNARHYISCEDQSLANRTNAFTLGYALAGFPWELLKPQYYLGDVIAPPTNALAQVDWRATYLHYEADADTEAFLFNTDSTGPCIFAAQGGTHVFTWYFRDGSSQEVAYTFATVAEGRPKRIYLTDFPYNGQKVSLQGRFVKFFGDEKLTNSGRNHLGVTTNYVSGIMNVQTNIVTEGLWLDESSMTLEARGERTGQVLMVYYADGNYDKILHVQAVEVCRPDTIANTGVIGTPLKPNGRGFEIDSTLRAVVKAGVGDSTDNRGDYLYIHQGQHDYSVHNGDVYPLRPTVGARWKAEICWMEEDAMQVEWPFEIDQYECDWPDEMAIFLRGDDASGEPGPAMTIPEDYTATLMDYQDPAGHAKDIDATGEFTTDLTGTGVQEGRSLVRLIADDAIYFMPVLSVARTHKDYYTLEPVKIPLGQEITLARASKSLIGTNVTFHATSEEPGYIYEPGTPKLNYDAALYEGSDVASSAIYAISDAGNIEVWWSAHYKTSEMPQPVVMPTLPMVVTPTVPETEEAPRIVLASQQGSANETRYAHFGAATFDSEQAYLALPDRVYFPNGNGTFALWTRPRALDEPLADVTNAPTSLLQFGANENGMLGLTIGDDETLRVQFGLGTCAEVPLRPYQKRVNDWLHIALTMDGSAKSKDCCLYLNGELAQTFTAELPSLPSTLRGRGSIGVSPYVGADIAVDRETALAKIFDIVDCTTWAELDEAFREGHNARLAADIEQTGTITIRSGETLALYMNGRTVTAAAGEAVRMFDIARGHLKIVGTGVFDGADLAFAGNGRFAAVGTDSKSASLTLNKRLVVRNMKTETNGSVAYAGGAIYANKGAVTVNGGAFSNCVASAGGAFAIAGSAALEIKGGTFANCSAVKGSGGVIQSSSAGASVTISGGEFLDNAAIGKGGVLSARNVVKVYGGVYKRNTASGDTATAFFDGRRNGCLLYGGVWDGDVRSSFATVASGHQMLQAGDVYAVGTGNMAVAGGKLTAGQFSFNVGRDEYESCGLVLAASRYAWPWQPDGDNPDNLCCQIYTVSEDKVKIDDVPVTADGGTGWTHNQTTHEIRLTENRTYVFSGSGMTERGYHFVVDADATIVFNDLMFVNRAGDHDVFRIAEGRTVRLELKDTDSAAEKSTVFSANDRFALTVASGATLTVTTDGEGRLIGGRDYGFSSGGVSVEKGGSLVWDDGHLSDYRATDVAGGITAAGRVSLTGGSIARCESVEAGGGVTLLDGGSFVMSGGRLSGCEAAFSGDAILAANRASVEIFGGTIFNCGTAPIRVQGSGETAVLPVIYAGVFDFTPEPAFLKAPADAFEIGKLKVYLTPTDPGRQVAEVCMFSRVLSADEVKEERDKVHEGSETGMTGYLSFRAGEDLDSVTQTQDVESRTYLDRSGDPVAACAAKDVYLGLPGAPLVGGCVLECDDGTTPVVYRQNDETLPGYNPNEEHATLRAGSGGYVLWALRCDLGKSGAHQAAIAEYAHDGRGMLQYCHVVATDETWPTLGGTCRAGQALPGPQPITLMDNPWLSEDYWVANEWNDAVYRDRKGQLWCRAGDREFDIHMYYRNQSGFDWPTLASPPAEGTVVPWLSALDRNASDREVVLNGDPHAWRWTTEWPTNGYATMKIGATLTVAENGLPEVWGAKSVAVVYPNPSAAAKVVQLSDPTVIQSVPFAMKLFNATKLSTDPNGGLVLRKGKYYFTEASPFLSSRFYFDPNVGTSSDANELGAICLMGEREEKNAGATVLYPNTLTSSERQALKALVPSDADAKAEWNAAIAELAPEPVIPNESKFRGRLRTGVTELRTSYGAVDHYALAAIGGTNWVVLIENDATEETMLNGDPCAVADGDPVSMHLIRVVPEYLSGRIVTREDENNLLSQQLTVLYTEPMGGNADDFEFEWWSHATTSDGTIPKTEGATTDDELIAKGWTKRPLTQTGSFNETSAGLTRFVIGQQGDTLANMVNTYYTCRYRALVGTEAYNTMGAAWSAFPDDAALAEGWIQRVLNNVTPFNQRMTDLYENAAETAVSMLEQAGGPFTGDVALNQDNLANVGLIQLYETLLDKAESMSLLLRVNDDGANKQLLLCAERLHDLYKVLGDEAYSDAKNPTIGFGDDAGIDFGSEASSLFCFDNQVSSLLDEELCLLRGRAVGTSHNEPYYNRLLWNFTKGVTAGEVAYAVNYNVGGTETVALSEEQAARIYPQGHGDAYGHYLSALKGWYRLLRNPYFSWPTAQGEMNVADTAINVDYYEEAKFAEAAADLAKTAADVVDLTARAAWRDAASSSRVAGYLDSNATNAFGYGEWASRGAYGALCNWVVANSLLPMDRQKKVAEYKSWSSTYVDSGLTRIDRGTVDELSDICDSAAAIVRAVDRADAGLNPLGLDDNAIPFDISPVGVASGLNTHYEQVRERAKTALGNARKILERAQTQSNRLRMIQETAETYAEQIEETEEDYNEELIRYYGTPYAGDIGVGKTYVQGYEGPDLLHYTWMDLSKYGLESVSNAVRTVYISTALSDMSSEDLINTFVSSTVVKTLTFDANGFAVKPSTVTGERSRTGTIQEKYGAFLTQYVKMKSVQRELEVRLAKFQLSVNHTLSIIRKQEQIDVLNEKLNDVQELLDKINARTEEAIEDIEEAEETTEGATEVIEDFAPSEVGVGMAVITSPRSFVEAVEEPIEYTSDLLSMAAERIVKAVQERAEAAVEKIEAKIDELEDEIEFEENDWEPACEIRDQYIEFNTYSVNLETEWVALQTCVDAYKSEVAKAETVLTKRENARKNQVSELSKYRYNEMLFRKIRDKTLAKYSSAFDLAQKLVYSTAQVYDYETALKRTADGSGDAFKAKIVTTRSLGAFDSSGEPMVADDGDLGLAGYLAQMDANWLVLKPRLGINNPQTYTTWFSLREELFRIYGSSDGDANWAQELKKHWVEDIQEHPVYLRHCQKFQSQFGLKDKEPGFVIPFSTTIDFAKNLFGLDITGGDHAYDSTWYSTRIASAGVWFDGYNQKTTNATSSARIQLAATPTVYLIPTGSDCMRAPGLSDGTFWKFSVVDQVIPAPYEIGSYELDDDTWYPSIDDADWGEGDATVKIRRHPMFRAYYGAGGAQPEEERLDATRLVGRSVWNDQWYLIIPAGAMNADRDKALSVFINGLDTNGDGKLDLAPVSDIKIGFRTYSQSGN